LGVAVSFLWNLIPGAREARNDLVVGYMWLAATGLWIGVPKVSDGTAGELTGAVGSIGIGIALSTIALLLGSFSSDLGSLIPGLREARTYTFGWRDPAAFLSVLTDKEKAELDALEQQINRAFSEVSFRLSLIPPVLIAGAAAAAHYHWWWSLVAVGVSLALAFQALIRRRRTVKDLYASQGLRKAIAMRAESEAVGRTELREFQM
jgi:hypothetical protein